MKSRLMCVKDFADFLSHSDSSLVEILNYLVRVILAPLSIDSAIYLQGNNSGEFSQVALSGVTKVAREEIYSKYFLSEQLPVAFTIKTGEIIWIDLEVNLRDLYPTLQNYRVLNGNRTFITVPVWVDQTPDSAIALTFKKNLKETPEAKAFLQAISNVFSLYYYRKIGVSPEEIQHHSESMSSSFSTPSGELTERQLVVLRLISEGQTNESISEFLGYSESTVRQEIVKIFDKLGCSNRIEAAEIYRDFTSRA